MLSSGQVTGFALGLTVSQPAHRTRRCQSSGNEVEWIGATLISRPIRHATVLLWTAWVALRDFQGLQLSDHVLTRGPGTHFWVDVEDSSVGTDVERPPRGELALRVDDAVRRRDFLLGIAEDGIVGFDVLGGFLFVSTSSTLAAKYTTLEKDRMFLPLSRSDLHWPFNHR